MIDLDPPYVHSSILSHDSLPTVTKAYQAAHEERLRDPKPRLSPIRVVWLPSRSTRRGKVEPLTRISLVHIVIVRVTRPPIGRIPLLVRDRSHGGWGGRPSRGGRSGAVPPTARQTRQLRGLSIVVVVAPPNSHVMWKILHLLALVLNNDNIS